MRIYILRHGKAEGIAADGSDAGRRLTPEGREAVRAVLLRARAVRAAPELILSSPLQRAIETAELAREILSCTGEVEPTSALAPSASRTRFGKNCGCGGPSSTACCWWGINP